MECLLVFLVLAVIVAVSLAIASQGGVSDRLNQAFFRLAQRYNGSSRPGGWSNPPEVRFRYGEARVLCQSLGRTFGGREMVLYLTFPDPYLWCHLIAPRRYETPPPGAVEIATPSPLAHTFLVLGRDPAAVQRFLTPGVQVQLEKLRLLVGTGQVEVGVGGGEMIFRKNFSIDRYEDLQMFLQCALELYDQAILSQAEGIEFGEAFANDPREAKCGVCGEFCLEGIVLCRRCGAPHHLECWAYNGSCSVFACRETEYVASRRS